MKDDLNSEEKPEEPQWPGARSMPIDPLARNRSELAADEASVAVRKTEPKTHI
jgi:hypothetical protein